MWTMMSCIRQAVGIRPRTCVTRHKACGSDAGNAMIAPMRRCSQPPPPPTHPRKCGRSGHCTPSGHHSLPKVYPFLVSPRRTLYPCKPHTVSHSAPLYPYGHHSLPQDYPFLVSPCWTDHPFLGPTHCLAPLWNHFLPPPLPPVDKNLAGAKNYKIFFGYNFQAL